MYNMKYDTNTETHSKSEYLEKEYKKIISPKNIFNKRQF